MAKSLQKLAKARQATATIALGVVAATTSKALTTTA